MRLSDFDLISTIGGEDGYFTWRGCDNVDCEGHNMGVTVYDCQGYKTLEEAKADYEGNLYEFSLCFDCIYEHGYGDRP